MKFEVTTSSDYGRYKPTIKKIRSLRKLLKFVKEEGRIIIDTNDDKKFSVEIYDDYRE